MVRISARIGVVEYDPNKGKDMGGVLHVLFKCEQGYEWVNLI